MRNRALSLGLSSSVAALLLAATASAVTVDWVTIDAAGNAPDTNPTNCGFLQTGACGAVAEVYQIGKYEVTNSQYAEFLNAVAVDDTYLLYNSSMNDNLLFGGITRTGVAGSYSYTVKPGYDDKPVTYVSFWDAARFSNWLENGQPVGAQGAGTTETGSYTISQAGILANTIARNPGATIFIPSEHEWYKAAYYDPDVANYFDYPTGTNAVIGCVAPASDTGNSANCASVLPSTLTDVGAYVLSGSPFGTFDQGGNVAEWHEGILGGSRGLRGGSWGGGPPDTNSDNQGYSAHTLEYAHVGFRLAGSVVIPEPSTALLVGAGLAGLALRQRPRHSARISRQW
jgi:formylglycine-generating enzyme required for sulfatase activity